MINLLLAILSSATIAIIMRASTNRVQGRLTMLSVNYLVCFTLAALYTDFGGVSASGSVGLILGMGAINGFFYLASFIMLQNSTRVNGVVLSTIFMKLGLLVPMAVSVFLFGEKPTILQLLGFLIAAVAIVLINSDGKNSAVQSRTGLILLLLMAGGADAMSKVFEEWGEPALSSNYLLYAFITALIMGIAAMLIKGERPGKYEIGFGLLVGIPNYFSAKFLLDALEYVPAVITYPTCNVGAILVVTLAGILFFREKLTRRQVLAIGIILVALVLLNL